MPLTWTRGAHRTITQDAGEQPTHSVKRFSIIGQEFDRAGDRRAVVARSMRTKPTGLEPATPAMMESEAQRAAEAQTVAATGRRERHQSEGDQGHW